ncbi:MAG TPA: endolytic transglycosylase MltG [Gammaproteobacteria bacterium]
MRKTLLIAVTALALLLIGAAAAGVVAWRELASPMPIAEPAEFFEIAPGTPLARVSAELGERGLVRQPWILTWYARLSGAATHIHAGEYRVARGTTPLELLDMLVAGRVHLHQVTIVEGWRFEDLLRALREHPAVQATDLDGAEIMAALGEPGVHPEGQFLPDTYSFPKGTSDLELLRLAHEGLERVLGAAWADRSADVALETPYDALILASIIEKETALDSERRLIAGVFNQRLKRGMRLQTDPTVIYGLGDVYDGNLRRRDLSTDTPYNTYTRAGLPPTPISLPSAASIEAAVNPAPGDALYFVATGLPDGSHYFSSTLEEHNRAVGRYLERLRNAPDQ